MKFEIEIKEECWKTIEDSFSYIEHSFSDIQILSKGKIDTKLSDYDLWKIIIDKFGTNEKDGYFYGYGFIPFVEGNFVDHYVFRTKSNTVYRIINLYSNKILHSLKKTK